MNISSDTKTMYILINEIEGKQLYEHIFKRNKVSQHPRWRYFTEDRLNGVKLAFKPLFPTRKFNVCLSFNGYSNNSQLLRDIFALISMDRWKIKRLDIAFDNHLPYQQQHAIHPPKKATVNHYTPTSVYIGKKRSFTQLAHYDKQRERREKKGIVTSTLTRAELRFRFPSMKRIADLRIEDLMAAKGYQVITDITMMPIQLLNIVDELNKGKKAGGIEWQDVTRTNQRKIREYGCEQGVNLYNLILSNVSNLHGFIYTPTDRPNERIS